MNDAQLASLNLLRFARYFWPQFMVGNHHLLIADHLHRVEQGKIDRLIINMPPRHGKSKLASEFLPAWWLGRNPHHKVICASSSQRFARKWGRAVRNTIRSPRFQEVFPGVTLSTDSKAALEFLVHKAGSREEPGEYNGLGIKGGSGLGAHLLLLDDPVADAEQADSAAHKDAFRDWYASVAETRLSPDGRVVLIQTRWREDDPAGWIQREFADDGWVVLSLPAVAEQEEQWPLPGGRSWIRKAGEPLWPERWPLQKLERKRAFFMKHGHGRDWWALYQQRPSPAEGTRVKITWFRTYQSPPRELARHCRLIVLSVDSARGDQDINDPSVIGVWGQTETGHHLLDIWKDRVRYPQLLGTLKRIAEDWRPHAVLIEKASSGVELLQDMQSQTGWPVIECSPRGRAKEVRLDAAAPTIEAGRVFLPEDAPWLPDFKREVATFPNGEHDDQVDQMSQYLNWCREGDHPVLPEEIAGSEDALEGLSAEIREMFKPTSGFGY